MFTLAHLSDLHATPVRVDRWGDVLNKRVLSWLSWSRKRHKEHRAEVLEALVEDLASVAPDHVAVTGDLTNLGLEHEFADALPWLERLGGPGRVSVVPGNHDALVAVPKERGFDHWSAYMGSTPDAKGGDGFPSLRRFGRMALVGVCSARPTLPLLASGRVGAEQRVRLEQLLATLAKEDVFRVVLIHHPPLPGVLSPRKHLSDASEVSEILSRHGAELVLHGHTHESSVAELPGPEGPIPVIGVPSSSAVGRHGPERRAGYHVYRIDLDAIGGFRLSWMTRGFDPLAKRFGPTGDRRHPTLTGR